MASPQCEDGFTRIANELLEKLLLLRIPGNELRVALAVMRLTYGYGKKHDTIAYSQIAKAVGISRTRAIYYVQRLVSRLVLYSLKGGTRKPAIMSINKDYEKWIHSPNGGTSPKGETIPSLKHETKSSPKRGTLQRKKEIIKKIYISPLLGEFGNVKLTEEEMQALKNKFSEFGASERIENLSGYLASKGDKYKSHYATILQWERRNSKEGVVDGTEEFLRRHEQDGKVLGKEGSNH